MPEWVISFSIVLASAVGMEFVASAVHRYVMHGWGWGWHRSHHEPRPGRVEKNDLYAVVFSGISLLLFTWGAAHYPRLYWVGVGMAVYGLIYALVHDGLVHRRFPFGRRPKHPYVKRLVQAHRLHHAVREREGAVSFGFLYAPPIAALKQELRSGQAAR